MLIVDIKQKLAYDKGLVACENSGTKLEAQSLRWQPVYFAENFKYPLFYNNFKFIKKEEFSLSYSQFFVHL